VILQYFDIDTIKIRSTICTSTYTMRLSER